MPVSTDDSRATPPVLATSNEPVAPKTKDGRPESVGNQALMDAIVVICVCWAVLFLLAWTLRAHNI